MRRANPPRPPCSPVPAIKGAPPHGHSTTELLLCSSSSCTTAAMARVAAAAAGAPRRRGARGDEYPLDTDIRDTLRVVSGELHRHEDETGQAVRNAAAWVELDAHARRFAAALPPRATPATTTITTEGLAAKRDRNGDQKGGDDDPAQPPTGDGKSGAGGRTSSAKRPDDAVLARLNKWPEDTESLANNNESVAAINATAQEEGISQASAQLRAATGLVRGGNRAGYRVLRDPSFNTAKSARNTAIYAKRLQWADTLAWDELLPPAATEVRDYFQKFVIYAASCNVGKVINLIGELKLLSEAQLSSSTKSKLNREKVVSLENSGKWTLASWVSHMKSLYQRDITGAQEFIRKYVCKILEDMLAKSDDEIPFEPLKPADRSHKLPGKQDRPAPAPQQGRAEDSGQLPGSDKPYEQMTEAEKEWVGVEADGAQYMREEEERRQNGGNRKDAYDNKRATEKDDEKRDRWFKTLPPGEQRALTKAAAEQQTSLRPLDQGEEPMPHESTSERPPQTAEGKAEQQEMDADRDDEDSEQSGSSEDEDDQNKRGTSNGKERMQHPVANAEDNQFLDDEESGSEISGSDEDGQVTPRGKGRHRRDETKESYQARVEKFKADNELSSSEDSSSEEETSNSEEEEGSELEGEGEVAPKRVRKTNACVGEELTKKNQRAEPASVATACKSFVTMPRSSFRASLC